MTAAAALVDDEYEDPPEPGSFDEDEDGPRAELGYQQTRPPPPEVYRKPVVPVATTRGVCRDCQDGFEGGGVALFASPSSIERTLCATCSGKRNRSIVEQVREVIRDLKAAAAVGNAGAERDHAKALALLVGEHQAGETVKAIRDRLSEPAAGRKKGGGR